MRPSLVLNKKMDIEESNVKSMLGDRIRIMEVGSFNQDESIHIEINRTASRHNVSKNKELPYRAMYISFANILCTQTSDKYIS